MKIVIVSIAMLTVSLMMWSFIVPQYILKERSIKRVLIAVLLPIIVTAGTICLEEEAVSLRDELAAQQTIVEELHAEIVDKQDEIKTLEALLEKKFNDAAPPRGNSDIYYDIKLPKALQLYTWQCCEYFGIDYKVFLSLMYVESGYDIDAGKDSQYVGLVQMSVDNIGYIEKELGIDIDIYNPYDNILAGTYWLSRYAAKYPDDVCMQLQCYNMGEANAKKNKNNTTYYNKILSYYLKI